MTRPALKNRFDADVALLTEARYQADEAPPGDWYFANVLRDDGLLRDALAARGLSSLRIDWARPGVDWSRFRCAVFRTTWDYFDRYAEFLAWLDRVEPQTTLLNPAETVRWNADKRYLGDLTAAGLPVVPTRFVGRGDRVSLADLFAETGWPEAVLKPCVSGAARHTYRLRRDEAEGMEAAFRRLAAEEAMMLQPFQHEIAASGETSLVVVGGRFTHAVRKAVRPGDFRVQDDHGGTVHAHEPGGEEVELAERAVAACRRRPAYARVDVVRGNDGGLALMELELIEPELWLRRHPPAAEALAVQVAGSLG